MYLFIFLLTMCYVVFFVLQFFIEGMTDKMLDTIIYKKSKKPDECPPIKLPGLSNEDPTCTIESQLVVSEPTKKIEKQKQPSKKTRTQKNLKSTALKVIEALVGLAEVKKEIIGLSNLARVNKAKIAHGLPVSTMSNHLVFIGNPGTGKTTVARLLGEIYRQLGVLSAGHVVEVDRSGLVAGYLGQTAIKTNDAIEKAKGGILFIDEAYSLAKDNDRFGEEAIDALIKGMEDNRDDLVVIVAGYTQEMDVFLNSNPGISSRFRKKMFFNDYSDTELIEILEAMIKEHGLKITKEATNKASLVFTKAKIEAGGTFGNARCVRNIFEHAIMRQSTRLSTKSRLTRFDLENITEEDIEAP